MGRCGGWIKILALGLVAFVASCGGSGGGPSGSGKPFVFESRGRLILGVDLPLPLLPPPVAAPDLDITATLLDPQGNPFRNQRVTFEAEFPDATIVPANTPQNVPLACLPPGSNGNATRCTNRGASITDDFGVARVKLIAGLTRGRMRLTAEAPASLNISSAFTVEIGSGGFIGGTALAILPTSLTFINPFINPNPGPGGTTAIFSAVGGFPPYRWDNTDKDLGRIDPQGIPGIFEKALYTLIGPIPTNISEVLTDTVILTDSRGTTVTAPVTVIFASCTLRLSEDEITFEQARPGDTLTVEILDGVPPYTISHTFPPAGSLSVTDDGTITYTIPRPVFSATDTVIVRDSRGCIGTFTVTITPASVRTLVLSAVPATVPNGGGDVVITAVAFDIDNRPLEDVTIVFSTTSGSFLPPLPAVRVTDADGQATITLRIPPSISPDASSVTVTATADNGVTASITIEVQAAPPPP